VFEHLWQIGKELIFSQAHKYAASSGVFYGPNQLTRVVESPVILKPTLD
jgi:hypothetical protein